jgi:hypothetical protein
MTPRAARDRANMRQRMLTAIEQPTLQGAIDSYGRQNNTFWHAVRVLDLEPTVDEKYAVELEARRLRGMAQSQAAAARGRAVHRANRTAARVAHDEALVEDADWLAQTGEHPANAAKRLGYETVKGLERALDRAHRPDLMLRLLDNDGMHKQRRLPFSSQHRA